MPRARTLAAALLLPLFAGAFARAETAEQLFSRNCAGCHGEGATGTDRGPSFINSRSLRGRSEAQIHDVIRNGTPGGMPAFPLTEADLVPLARFVRAFNASAFDIKPAGDADAGERFFFDKGNAPPVTWCGDAARRTGRTFPARDAS